MKYLIISLIFLCCSCSNEKIVQLPDIPNASVTEVLDVSPAYIFYNEAMVDSVEFNRKNLISTTNWLVNVDKRLRLKQAIPHIQYLQDKRRNAEMHKNDSAKNYFTCRDTSVNNLGFIEFTKAYYIQDDAREYYNKNKPTIKADQYISIYVNSLDSIEVNFFSDGYSLINDSNLNALSNTIKLGLIQKGNSILNLCFSENLSFQDYISIKSTVANLSYHNLTIDNNEFIY